MELKYPVFIIAGIVLVIAFLIVYSLRKTKKREFKEGIKVANTFYLNEDPYYKKKKRLYKFYSVIMVLAICVSIMASAFLLARPHKIEKVADERYCRDIFLCLDVSTSVDELNKSLVKELKTTVENLKGERFGIIIFNTSPVLLSPLTDDYEYIIEQLDEIEISLRKRISLSNSYYAPNDYWYYDEYISGGTLVGNEERGSSLIGDGLAASAYHFSDEETDRPRIVIFATDNDVYGRELVTLPEAAEICKKKNITVYGIGTKEMTESNLREMKAAVENTGGQFYLEEESGTFRKIVEKIEEQSEGLVKVNNYVREVNYPRAPFILLSVSILLLFVVGKKLRLRG